MLRQGLKTAYYHSLMHIDHYLKNADQWQSYNLVWCHFVCTICLVGINVDEKCCLLTIAEHVAWWDPVVVEIFVLCTDYHSDTYIHI